MKNFFLSCISFILVVFACCSTYTIWELFLSCHIPPFDSQVEVVVSACRDPILQSVSPDGNYITYKADKKLRLLNLITGEETLLNAEGELWLSENWLLQEGYVDGESVFWLFDITTKTRVPLHSVSDIPDMVSRSDKERLLLNPRLLTLFQQANEVYFGSEKGTSIAILSLSGNLNNEEDTYILAPSRMFSGDSQVIAGFIEESAIPYKNLTYKNFIHFEDKVRFVVDGTTIMNQRGEIVVKGKERTISYGWSHDGRGIYFQPYRTSSFAGFLILPSSWQEPILKLKIPESYPVE